MKVGIRSFGAALILSASAWAGRTWAQEPLAEVPFTFYQNGIILPVLLNGKDTLHLLLDTGWGPLALVSSAAERLRLRVPAPAAAGDLPRTRQASLGAGRAIKRDPVFEVFPASELSPLIGPHDGILSTAFFNDLVLQVDYPRRLVRFYDRSPDGTRVSGGGADRTTVPMVFSPGAGALPFTDSVFVDGGPVRTLFDTGGAGAFLATDGLVRRLQLTPSADSVRGRIGMLSEGRATQAPIRFALVGRISLGTIVVESPRVIMAPPQLEGGAWGHELIVGSGFMQHYVVTFDYPRRRVTFERPDLQR
jgi:hypothetical protein